MDKTRNTKMKIVILGGHCEDGDEMAFYVDGKLIKTTVIDGGLDCPETVMDFMSEFHLKTTDAGITEMADLDRKPDVVTNKGRLCFESDEQYETFVAAHPNHVEDPEGDLYFPFPNILTDEELEKYTN